MFGILIRESVTSAELVRYCEFMFDCLLLPFFSVYHLLKELRFSEARKLVQEYKMTSDVSFPLIHDKLIILLSLSLSHAYRLSSSSETRRTEHILSVSNDVSICCYFSRLYFSESGEAILLVHRCLLM